MPLRKYTMFLITILLLMSKIKSDIANCLFVNTVNLTNTNSMYYDSNDIEIKIEPHLVEFYDFIVLRNGSKVSVPQHKRGCICPNPCLSFCSPDVITEYYNNSAMEQSYQRNVTLENGDVRSQDFIKYFNHRFPDIECQILYPLSMELKNDKWSIFENGTLLLSYTMDYKNHEEYCFDLYSFSLNDLDEDYIITPYLCAQPNIRNKLDTFKNLAMLCSIPFFIMTIFVYCLLPEFRNCHGKCFVMYLLYLTVTYSLICYKTLTSGELEKMPCITIGYAVYFGTIGFLTWISIISYDTFVSLTDLDSRTLFRKYLKWGIVIPSVATFLIFLIQSIKSINEEYKPGIGSDSCGVKAVGWSGTFYFYIPHIIVFVLCLTLYIKLIRFLVQNEREATSFAGRLKASYMKRFALYFRLFIFMGVVWFLEILSYFIDMYKGRNIISFIADLFNGLHGLFIFFSIIFNSRIYRYFRKRCCPARYAERELMTLTSRTSSQLVH